MSNDRKNNLWTGTLVVMTGIAVSAMIYFNPDRTTQPRMGGLHGNRQFCLRRTQYCFQGIGKTTAVCLHGCLHHALIRVDWRLDRVWPGCAGVFGHIDGFHVGQARLVMPWNIWTKRNHLCPGGILYVVKNTSWPTLDSLKA